MLTKEKAAALTRPFDASEIEWRVGQAGLKADGTPWVRALPYLTSRAAMERLDEVFGVGGWSDSIREVNLGEIVDDKGRVTPVRGMICTLRVRVEDGTWIEHEDVAECSDIEPLKGSASGALKRVAVKLGLGRYLYYLEDGFATVTPNGKFRHSGEDKKTKKHFECRWNPPALPAWALPKKGEGRFNPYAAAAAAAAVGPGDGFPPSSAPTDSSEQFLGYPPASQQDEGATTEEFPGLSIPDGMDPVFVDGIRKTLRTTKAVATLRATYTKAVEKALTLGVRLVPALDPKMLPVEIANHVLDAKAKIVEAELRKAA